MCIVFFPSVNKGNHFSQKPACRQMHWLHSEHVVNNMSDRGTVWDLHVWKGVCMAGVMPDRGVYDRGHAWQGDMQGRGCLWQ